MTEEHGRDDLSEPYTLCRCKLKTHHIGVQVRPPAQLRRLEAVLLSPLHVLLQDRLVRELDRLTAPLVRFVRLRNTIQTVLQLHGTIPTVA